MAEQPDSATLLRKYRSIQASEGLTLESELRLAKLQGDAWREYVTACQAEGIEPESMDFPR